MQESRRPGEEKMKGVDCAIDAVGYQARDDGNPKKEKPTQVLENCLKVVNATGGVGIIGVYIATILALRVTPSRASFHFLLPNSSTRGSSRESGALLLGERTNRSRIRRLRQIVLAESLVEEAGELLTMQMGPNQVLLTAAIRFRRGLVVEELESAIVRLEAHIRQKEPTIKKVFFEPASLKRADDEQHQ